MARIKSLTASWWRTNLLLTALSHTRHEQEIRGRGGQAVGVVRGGVAVAVVVGAAESGSEISP